MMDASVKSALDCSLITFVESIGTVLLERGIYFFTHERLAFTERENLLLALLFGAVLRLPARFRATARRTGSGKARCSTPRCSACWRSTWCSYFVRRARSITGAFVALALFHGLKWPSDREFLQRRPDAGAPAARARPVQRVLGAGGADRGRRDQVH